MCEAISGYFVVLARNCLASTLDYIVMQMRKINREKGYWFSHHGTCMPCSTNMVSAWASLRTVFPFIVV